MDYQKHLEICRAVAPEEWEATYLNDKEIYITIHYDNKHKTDWIAEIDPYDNNDKSVEAKLADAEFIAFARNHTEQYITRCMELEAEIKLLREALDSYENTEWVDRKPLRLTKS